MNYVQGGVSAAATVYEGYQHAADLETAAKQYDENATTARVQGNADEDRQRFGIATKLGVQRANIAESGFDSTSASLDTLQGQSRGQLELDALTTRYRAELTARDWENQRDGANAAARRTRHNANIQKISAFIGGAMGGGGGGGYKDTGYQPNRYGSNEGGYGQGQGMNQGGYGGDVGGSYWGTE